jgi:hypothetical protein
LLSSLDGITRDQDRCIAARRSARQAPPIFPTRARELRSFNSTPLVAQQTRR